MNYEALLPDLMAAFAKHAPGGMVGAFVIAVELYDEDGSPQLHTIRDGQANGWTHLGQAHALLKDIESPFRRAYGQDGGDG